MFGKQAVRLALIAPHLDALAEKVDAVYTGSGSYAGYEFPVSLGGTSMRLMSANYYDTYAFASSDSRLALQNQKGYGTAYPHAHGKLTGTAIFTTGGTCLLAAYYYDSHGRTVQRRVQNHLGGHEEEYTVYSFTGQPLQRKQVHAAPAQPIRTHVITHTYDHLDRPLTTSLDGRPIAETAYDELGRVERVRHYGHDMRYAYNVRDWTTAIGGTRSTYA